MERRHPAPPRPSFTSSLYHMILGSLVWILLSPLVLLFFLPFLLLRLSHNLLASILRPDLTPLWGLIDSVMALTPTSQGLNMNTAQVWRLDGILTEEAFRTHFHACFLSSPKLLRRYANLRSRIVPWGCYTFKKTLEGPLDLRKVIKTGPEHLHGKDFTELQPFIADYMASSDYDLEGPAWSALILPLKGSQTLLLLKMDHALTDGYTFGHLASVLAGTTPPYLVKGHGMGVLRRVEIFLTYPKLALGQLWGYRKAGLVPYPRNDKISNVNDQRWMMSFTKLDLERVKQVRRMVDVGGVGVHFNTVLGSVVIAALGRHCTLHHEEDKGCKNGKESSTPSNLAKSKLQLPANAWLLSPVGWPNHPVMVGGGAMVNHMSLRNTSYPLGATTDPIVRLVGGEKGVQSAELHGQAIGFHWIIASLAWMMPSPLFASWMHSLSSGRGLLDGGLSQVLTPLLLSPQPHRLLGLDVVELYLPVHTPNLIVPAKVYVVPVSVGGRLEVSVSGRSDAFPDQASLDRFTKVLLGQELDALHSALLTRQELANTQKIGNNKDTTIQIQH